MSAALLDLPLTTLPMSLRTPNGECAVTFEFDLASDVQRHMHTVLSAGAFYEPETTLLLLSVLRPGDRFVDVGGISATSRSSRRRWLGQRGACSPLSRRLRITRVSCAT